MYQIFYITIFGNMSTKYFNTPEKILEFLAHNFKYITNFVIRNNKGEIIAMTEID